jgi:hypothetical protein
MDVLSQFIGRPFEYVNYFTVIMHAVRYLLIVNVNHMKGLFCQIGSTVVVTWRLRILQVITKPWFTAMIVLVFFYMVEFYMFILLASQHFICWSENMPSLVYISAAIIPASIFCISMIVLVWDIFQNYKL